MDIVNTKAEAVDVAALKPHPRNPREGDVGAIAESIKENGWYGTIIAQQGTNYILAGNHRWQAAQALGMTKVPVTWVDVNDDTALRILLADNRTSDLARHDENALADLLKELSSHDKLLSGTGWDANDLDNLLADLSTEMIYKGLSDPQEKLEVFQNAEIMSIMLVLSKEEFAFAVSILQKMMESDSSLQSNSDAVISLLRDWSEQSQK